MQCTTELRIVLTWCRCLTHLPWAPIVRSPYPSSPHNSAGYQCLRHHEAHATPDCKRPWWCLAASEDLRAVQEYLRGKKNQNYFNSIFLFGLFPKPFKVLNIDGSIWTLYPCVIDELHEGGLYFLTVVSNTLFFASQPVLALSLPHHCTYSSHTFSKIYSSFKLHSSLCSLFLRRLFCILSLNSVHGYGWSYLVR